MKKSALILFIIAILLIAVGNIIYFIDKGDDKNGKVTKEGIGVEESKNYIIHLTDLIINGGSKKELEKALKTDKIYDADIMTGKDMYLRQKPNNKLLKKYNLTNYVTKGEELANNLETKIKDNFDYTIKNVIKGTEYTSVKVSYKTYYYTSYMKDLYFIQNSLLIKAGYDLNNLSENEKFIIDLYKAKIKAASLLDNFLEDYVNKDEFLETTVSYTNNNINESSKEFMSYFINLTGGAYSSTNKLNTEEDVNNFLKNYDLTNPLDI